MKTAGLITSTCGSLLAQNPACYSPSILSIGCGLRVQTRDTPLTTWARRSVPPRHIKRPTERAGPGAQVDWACEQILQVLKNHRHPESVEVEVWEQQPLVVEHRGDHWTRFDSFVQHRKVDSERARVYGATLRFAEPQSGPISIGREAHFGLGQFTPSMNT